jgi:hypothetical protein
MERKYKSLYIKINKLTQTQTNNQNADIQFYPRVINKTNVFSDIKLACLTDNKVVCVFFGLFRYLLSAFFVWG